MVDFQATQSVHELVCHLLCIAELFEQTETDQQRLQLYELLDNVQRQLSQYTQILPHMRDVIGMYTSIHNLASIDAKLRKNPYPPEFKAAVMNNVKDILAEAKKNAADS